MVYRLLRIEREGASCRNLLDPPRHSGSFFLKLVGLF